MIEEAATSEKSQIEQLRNELASKNTLLSLSRDIAAIQVKEDLNRLIRKKFGDLFYFYHCTICIICEDQKSYRAFLLDPESKVKVHEKYRHLIKDSYALNNGIDDVIVNSDSAVYFDFDQLVIENKMPPQGLIIYESGLVESVGCRFRLDGKVFGFIVFYSDTKNKLGPRQFWLIENIAAMVAPAVANILAAEEIALRAKEKEGLLELSSAINHVKDRNDLLEVINTKLKQLFYFSHSITQTFSQDKQWLNTFLLDPNSQSKNDPDYHYIVSRQTAVNDGIVDRLLEMDDPIVIDLEQRVQSETAPGYVYLNYKNGLSELLGVVLRTANREPIGTIALFSDRKGGFTPAVVRLMKGIGYHLSTAMSNILYNEEISKREKEKSVLLSLSSQMAQIRNQTDLLQMMRLELKKLFYFTHSNIVLLSEDKSKMRAYLLDPESKLRDHPSYNKFVTDTHEVESIPRKVADSELPVLMDLDALAASGEIPNVLKLQHQMGIKEVIAVSLRNENDVFGILIFYSDIKTTFHESLFEIIRGVGNQVAVAVANILANEKIDRQLEEIKGYKERLEEENLYLHEEISSGYSFGDIIGSGPEMRKVFQLLNQVAGSDSTVLILGETGTGKELVARALHNASRRKEKLMVKVNCAALPPTLIESELFGHEKGSFTGATERRIGKFELANNGTLFLDEIGEMPLDLQVKLLRAIQEREIERVGGKQVIKVNVRIVTATNRNLQKEVDEGRFRRDLFYRINVFPIKLPPLRDRKSDIPALVSYFIKKFSKSTGKRVESISTSAMDELTSYHWPGNIRELEHLIERSVLTSVSSNLQHMHLPKIDPVATEIDAGEHMKTFEENERDHILKVIEKCNGKLFGRGGAAEILDMNISTLNNKIKKLGIKKEKGLYS